MIFIKNIFPKNENEKMLVEFIGRYQYLYFKDAKYFFNDTYYLKRITKLIDNGLIRKYKNYYVLADNGLDYLKLINKTANKLRYQKHYVSRLKYISHLAAFYNKEPHINFIPSFEIKDKEVFTETARKYIGILNVFGTKYLVYRISEDSTPRYISSLIYDIQKEQSFKNILILVNNINKIDFNRFAFGLNSVIICEDNNTELEKLKYLHQINNSKIIADNYKHKLHISEYNFCNYTDSINKFVSIFYFLDIEKINRIDTFIRNNTDKQADIICCEEILRLLGRELPLANFKVIDFDNYIEREIQVYD